MVLWVYYLTFLSHFLGLKPWALTEFAVKIRSTCDFSILGLNGFDSRHLLSEKCYFARFLQNRVNFVCQLFTAIKKEGSHLRVLFLLLHGVYYLPYCLVVITCTSKQLFSRGLSVCTSPLSCPDLFCDFLV